MSQWGSTDDAANSVSWAAKTIQAGSGETNIAANNTALYGNTTPDAFVEKIAIGQFGVSKAEMKVSSGEGPKVHAPGWNLRRVGQGPLIGLTVSAGAGFVNGDTLIVSNGEVNATLILTTNATGNLVSASVADGGRFPNTSILVYTFTHEKHLNATAGFTKTNGGLGYDNTDYIVVSNGIVDARATMNTLSTGNINVITVTNPGQFGATEANADAVVTIYAANGGASNGTSAVLVANLVASTGGTNTAPVLGGRAGRVTYEALAVVKGITSGTSDDAILPNS